MKLFSAQVRDQTESVADEGQASRAKRSVSVTDQALKASDSVRDQSSSVQSSSNQPESELKSSRPDQFSSSVPVSSDNSQSS